MYSRKAFIPEMRRNKRVINIRERLVFESDQSFKGIPATRNNELSFFHTPVVSNVHDRWRHDTDVNEQQSNEWLFSIVNGCRL